MDEVLDYFNKYYEPARRHQEGMSNEWAQYERAYYGEPEQSKPAGENAWRSFIFYKYAHQQIKTLVAELASDDEPTFVYEARLPSQEPYSRIADSLVGYQLQRDGYSRKRLQAIEYATLYGGCPVKIHWSYETVKRRRITASGIKTEEYVIRDQPTINIIDPRDFMYDVRARTMSECRYAFHRMRLSIEELKSRKRSDGKPLYHNLDELHEAVGGTNSQQIDRDLDHDYAGERDKALRLGIEVIEMWTRDRVIVRAGSGTIIRDDPSPYWHGRLPFEVINVMPSLNDVWGESIIWLLRDAQESIWTLDNAQNDLLKLGIDPPLAVDIDADPDNAHRPIAPRERFKTRGDSANAVVPIRVTGMEPYVGDNAIAAQLQKLEKITGITDEVAGQSTADTATQAALNQRQSKGRIGIMMRSIDDSFARVAEMFLALDQQYLDMSIPIRLLGPDGAVWQHMAPDHIAGIWDVRAKNSSEKVVKELRRQNLMEGLSAIMPAVDRATASGKTVDITPFVEELCESFGIPKERVVVDADRMREQHTKDVVSDAKAQSFAQSLMQPPEDPNATQDPAGDVQRKIFESVNYKDLPDPAQAAMLESIGLPSDGVSNDSPIVKAGIEAAKNDANNAHAADMSNMDRNHQVHMQRLQQGGEQ